MPLLGERGLLPVARFVEAVPFRASPSLFFLHPTDARSAALLARRSCCRSSRSVVSCSAAARSRRPACGRFSGFLYLSFVNVGQTFYAFGWESLLLEVGFFAILPALATTMPRDHV